MCLSNFKAMRQFKVPISWLRDFTRSYENTYFRILRRGPVSFRFENRWPVPTNNLARTRLAFRVLTFTNKILLPAHGWYFMSESLQTKYLYSQSMYLKLSFGKCHIPVHQGLEHSIYNRWVVGSSPAIKFRLLQEHFFIKNGCYCPRMAGISCVNLYKHNICVSTIKYLQNWSITKVIMHPSIYLITYAPWAETATQSCALSSVRLAISESLHIELNIRLFENSAHTGFSVVNIDWLCQYITLRA